MHVVRMNVTNLMDVVLVPTVAGFVAPLVELSKVVDVSIDVVVVVPFYWEGYGLQELRCCCNGDFNNLCIKPLISSKSFIIFFNCPFSCPVVPSQLAVPPLGCLDLLIGLFGVFSLPDSLSESVLELPERFMLSSISLILLVTSLTVVSNLSNKSFL